MASEVPDPGVCDRCRGTRRRRLPGIWSARYRACSGRIARSPVRWSTSGWHAHSGQDGTDVDLLVHLHDGHRGSGARREAPIMWPTIAGYGSSFAAPGARTSLAALSPQALLYGLDHGPPFLLRVAEGMVGRPGAARIGDHRAPARRCGRDRWRRRAATSDHFGDPEEGGALRATQHPLTARTSSMRCSSVGIPPTRSESRAALVEADEPRRCPAARSNVQARVLTPPGVTRSPAPPRGQAPAPLTWYAM